VLETRVRAADSIFNHAAKAIEIEDIEARVSELERAAEAQKKHQATMRTISRRLARIEKNLAPA
jgi:hypothetical protein